MAPMHTWLLLVTGVIFFHIVMVKIFPTLAIFLAFENKVRRSLEKRNRGANTIISAKKVDHSSRDIVIPCPDFSYGYGIIEIAADEALLVDAPANTDIHYANFALYDDEGIARHSFTYGSKGLRIALIRAGSSGSADSSGATQRDFYLKGYDKVFINRRSFTMLQRILLTSSFGYDEALAYTDSIRIERQQGNGHQGVGHRAIHWLLLLPPLILGIVYTHTIIDVKTCALAALNKTFWGNLLCMLAISASLTAVVIGYGNSSTGIFGFVSTRVVSNNWIFMTFPIDRQRGVKLLDCLYGRLFMMLHGALNLPAEDVVYGKLFVDSTGEPLRNNMSYDLDMTGVCTMSKWYSVTVYGDDKFLIQNDYDIYSVTSLHLESYNTKPNSIYISSQPRNSSDQEPFIPLSNKMTSTFTAIIRMYEPYSGFSLDGVKLPLMRAII